MSNAIVCRQLYKQYPGKPPVDAVNGLDLTIGAGECFGLLGPNGAGKTTTIEILEGLLDATRGDVEVLGMKWGQNDNNIRQQIGISLQDTKLSEKLTILETLTLFRSFYRQGITAEEAVARVSLEEKLKARVGKLSGGQKQRLAVACALIGDPKLLFMDEPTTGLDPQSRRQLWDIIRSFKELGRTVLLTTHYMDEAERLCDRVAIVDHGKVIAGGSPRELIASLGGEHILDFSVVNSNGEGRLPSSSFAGLPAVRSVRVEDGVYSLAVTEPHIALPAVLERLRQTNRELSGLTTRHASLEDVFVTLTGRHLREGPPAP
jgi:ABC-2 type transport system ATP-binding protein